MRGIERKREAEKGSERKNGWVEKEKDKKRGRKG